MKTCIIEGCINECEKGRRYCREHYLERKRKQAKEHYIKFGRYNYNCICVLCGKHFIGARKETRFCSKECLDNYYKIDSHDVMGHYLFKEKTLINEHRAIVEELLHLKLSYNKVIHHLDGNPRNNSLNNLIILSRSNHTKLHAFLTKKKFELVKQFGENIDDYWNSIKVKISEEWLNSENKTYIKASEIENQKNIEEILGFL